MGAQRSNIHLQDFVVVELDLARIGIVEALQQLDTGRFSASAVADQGHGLSRFDGEAKLLKHAHVLARRIAKFYRIHRHVAGNLTHLFPVW